MKKILLLIIFFGRFLSADAQTRLYGLSFLGGENDKGVLYSYDITTNSIKAIISFNDANGRNPYFGLLKGTDSKLYGMTFGGGSFDKGVIFSFSPATENYIVLHNFDEQNASYPMGNLIQATNGILYGLASRGGLHNDGVIFSFNLSTNTFKVLHAFNHEDPQDGGYSPIGSLMQAEDGKLYGCVRGGVNDGGVIFSYDIVSGTYKKVFDGIGPPHSDPFGNLLQAPDGKLYGTFFDHLDELKGGIFSFNPADEVYTVIHEFNGADGQYPYGSLVQGTGSALMGMTWQGGTNNLGVLYSYDISNNQYTVVHNFDGLDGAYPREGLLLASNLQFYGTAGSGGDLGLGVLFCYNPVTQEYKKLQDFDGLNGAQPAYGGLVEADVCTPLFYATIPDARAMEAGVEVNTVYKGYFPASSILLNVDIPAGAGYTYQWSNGSTTPSITVNPLKTTTYTVTVTSASGCSVTASKEVKVVDIRCGNGNDKVLVCKAKGNSPNDKALCISPNAVKTQLDNGGVLGDCRGKKPTQACGILQILAAPNPTRSGFALYINTNNPNEKIYLKVYNSFGTLIDVKTIIGNQVLELGSSYQQGIYFIEAVQREEKATLKLVKNK